MDRKLDQKDATYLRDVLAWLESYALSGEPVPEPMLRAASDQIRSMRDKMEAPDWDAGLIALRVSQSESDTDTH